MVLKLTHKQYQHIHTLTFGDPEYAGYKPNVQESPNGDGVWDDKKRYAHVAPKYNPSSWLRAYYNAAFNEALRVHALLGFPGYLRPSWTECCLRILEYSPTAFSAEHTDFDLFTLQLYRDWRPGFVRVGEVRPGDDEASEGIHFGEMAEVAQLRPAMRHAVRPNPFKITRSIVFFALPDRDAPLVYAGDWLDERYARSRRSA